MKFKQKTTPHIIFDKNVNRKCRRTENVSEQEMGVNENGGEQKSIS